MLKNNPLSGNEKCCYTCSHADACIQYDHECYIDAEQEALNEDGYTDDNIHFCKHYQHYSVKPMIVVPSSCFDCSNVSFDHRIKKMIIVRKYADDSPCTKETAKLCALMRK
jgi:hypothetical protein